MTATTGGAVGQIGYLIARCLDDPVIGFGRRRWVPWRLPDVAAHFGVVAEPAEQVTSDGSGGALSLGAGDARHSFQGDVLQPEPETAAHRDACPLELCDLGAVATDAWALDHDLAADECPEAALSGGQNFKVVERGPNRFVVDQDRDHAHRLEPAEAGPSFDSQAPQADRRASERGPGDRWAHSDRGCDGIRRVTRGRSPRGSHRLGAASTAARNDWRRELAWRSDRAAARRTAARHSPTSPTHSNGRASGASPSSVTKRPSSSALSKGSRPPKISRRSSASMKGDRIRSMKQHLSQVPHHWPRRSAGFCWKARLQLRKTPWNSLSWANCCATHSSLRLRRYEKTESCGPNASPTMWAKPSSNSAPLDHWWLIGRPSCTSVGAEADHSLDSTTASRPIENRRDEGGRGDDRRDGNVAVEEAHPLGAPDLGVDLAGNVDHGQPGQSGRVFDGGKPFIWGMDDTEGRIGGALPKCADGHDGVDAAAEWDQRAHRVDCVGDVVRAWRFGLLEPDP